MNETNVDPKRRAAGLRLRQARIRRGYETAFAAARAHGWPLYTYAAHENGNRGISPRVAERYAKAFKVSPAWILTGERAMQSPLTVPLVGEIVNGGHVLPYRPRGDTAFEQVRTPPDSSPDTIAFKVGVAGMPGLGDSGWTLYVDDVRMDPADVAAGTLALVGSGEDLEKARIRRILPGSKPGRFHLTIGESILTDQTIEWASPVTWLTPV